MTLGAGASPAGFGPFGGSTPPELVEPITTAISCREIDPLAADYTTDGQGNPNVMSATANRVYLLCAFNDKQSPIITPAALSDRQQTLTKALVPLTRGQKPAISNLTVSVTAGDNGVSVVVDYFDNNTQQKESVILR